MATGVTADGHREVLGLGVGHSEDIVFWTALLRSLKDRGLTGVFLVISDDLADETLRVWTVHSYLVIYRPDTEPLQVVRVLSGYRDIGASSSEDAGSTRYHMVRCSPDSPLASIQHDGTCWLGGTTWRERRLLRISVSNHTTTEEDVDRSVDAILAATRA